MYSLTATPRRDTRRHRDDHADQRRRAGRHRVPPHRDGSLRLLRRSFDLGYKDPEIKVIREFETIRTEPEFVAMVDEIRERSREAD